MRVYLYVLACLVALMPLSTNASKKQKKARKAKTELWPDGTKMDSWFLQAQKVNIDTLGKQYVVTDYGVKTDSTLLQTSAIQGVIDLASKNGGGVVVIPEGTFLSGALFFRPKTHLLLSEGGKLKASDRIVLWRIGCAVEEHVVDAGTEHQVHIGFHLTQRRAEVLGEPGESLA